VIIRLLLIALGIGSLFGCSGGGGFLPNGPHAMNQQALNSVVAAASTEHDVPAKLVKAVIRAESGGDPSAISRSGAQGLMQLMPATAQIYGVVNPFDPSMNVDAGAHYLHDLLVRYHHNLALALAAYNAGPGAVDAAHGVPSFAETRAYVARVTAAYRSN
jgi:soluble lytic murein transglycosylase-like protein